MSKQEARVRRAAGGKLRVAPERLAGILVYRFFAPKQDFKRFTFGFVCDAMEQFGGRGNRCRTFPKKNGSHHGRAVDPDPVHCLFSVKKIQDRVLVTIRIHGNLDKIRTLP